MIQNLIQAISCSFIQDKIYDSGGSCLLWVVTKVAAFTAPLDLPTCAQWPNTRTLEHRILYQNSVCAPLQPKIRDTTTTMIHLFSGYHPIECFKVKAHWVCLVVLSTAMVLKKCQFCSKHHQCESIWSPLVTSSHRPISHSKTCTPLLLISKTAEKGGFLGCARKSHAGQLPAKAAEFYGEPWTYSFPGNMRWLLWVCRKSLTGKAPAHLNSLSFWLLGPRPFEGFWKVTFEGCSNWSF